MDDAYSHSFPLRDKWDADLRRLTPIIKVPNNDPIVISNIVIPRLDRGIQKNIGCPLKTCGHDEQTGMKLHYMSIQS